MRERLDIRRGNRQNACKGPLCVCKLTVADKIFLCHIRNVKAPHVGGGHALGEGRQAPPRSEPIGEPGQVTVAVETVGVQAPENGGSH